MSAVGFSIETGALQFEDGSRAFSDLSVSMEPGKLTVVLGPSGCGKTTLLRVIGGLLPLSKGTLTFVNDAQERLRQTPKTSFCFQEPRLLPWATVSQNIELPGRLSRKLEPNRVHTLLDWVELKSEHASLRPSELSGGMQMRVGLARALYHEPELLLLDEPFAALDELTRASLDDLLLNLVKSRNMSAVMVTHSVAEAVYLADEIWVLTAQPGRLLGRFLSPFSVKTPEIRTTKAFAEAVANVHLMLAKGSSEAAS